MNEDVPAVMAEKLSWLTGSWTSIELRISKDVRNSDGARADVQEWYVETALGQRLYDWSCPARTGEPFRRANYADGRRFAEATWDGPQQETVRYIKAFEAAEETTPCCWRPEPLRFLYLDQQPLARTLTRAEWLGQERRLGRECEVLVLKDVKWSYTPVDIVYTLDRETAIPLSVRCYNAGADRARDQPQWYWEAKSFDRVGDGRYWPLRSADFVYAPTEGGGTELLTSREIQVESIHFDKEHPEAIFRPVLEPGAAVLDTTTGKHFTVPGERAAPVTAATAEPVRATRPTDWSSTASSAGLVLGLALLGAGAAVWWWRYRL